MRNLRNSVVIAFLSLLIFSCSERVRNEETERLAFSEDQSKIFEENEEEQKVEEGPGPLIRVVLNPKSNGNLLNVEELGGKSAAGRTLALSIDAADNNHLIVGTDGGGIWNSYDRGQSWAPVDDQLPSMVVRDIAQDHFSNNIFYATATARLETDNGDKLPDIYRSIDGGATFQLLPIMHEDSVPMNTYQVETSPVDPDVIYTRSYFFPTSGLPEHVLFRSTDGGSTFSKVAAHSASSDVIQSFDLLPDGSVIYATRYSFYRSPSGDPGTFSELYSGFSGHFKAKLKHCADDPDILYLFAGVSGALEVMKSLDGGNSWATLAPITSGYFGSALGVKPDNCDLVLTGGVALNVTTDGGSDWQLYNFNGVDNWDVQYDTIMTDDVYITNDGGVARYDIEPFNPNFSHSDVERLDSLLANNMIHAGDYHDYGKRAIIGLQDIGTRWNRNGGMDFGGVWGNDGSYCYFNRTDTNVAYVSYQSGRIMKVSDIYAFPVYYPTNIQYATNQLDADANFSIDEGALFIHPFWVNYVNGDQLFFPTKQRLWRSLDGADNWTPASDFYTSSGSVISICIDGVSKPDPILYWSINDTLYTMENAATATPADVLKTEMPQLIRSIKCDPHNDSTIYVTCTTSFSQRVLKVTGLMGNNVAYVDITGDLPEGLLVYDVQPSAISDSILAVSTEKGLYTSTNHGLNWVKEGGLPNTRIKMLKIRPSDNKLFVFTYGRGVWVADLPDQNIPTIAPEIAIIEDLKLYPNPVTEQQFTVELPSDMSGADIVIYDLTGKEVGSQKANGSVNVIRTEELKTGTYLLRVENRNKAVVRRFVKL